MVRAGKPGSPRKKRGRSTRSTDLLLLSGLVGSFFLLICFVLLLSPASGALNLERPTAPAELRGFYGVEQNAAGSFRWSKPVAAMAIPVGAPGRYRIQLTIQDSPAAPPGRQLTIASGDTTTTVEPGPFLKTYLLDTTLTPREWAQTPGQTLTIDLRTTPYLPPGDPRTLGVIVSGVEISPLGPTAPDWVGVGLFVCTVGLVAAMILAASRSRRAVLLYGLVVVVAGATIAIVDRRSALFLLYQPLLHPTALWLMLAGALTLIFLASAVAHAIPPVAAADLSSPSRYLDLGLLCALLCCAALLRFGGLNHLSLWLDEGATIHFAALPWREVLGLHGQYDFHPPLYYLLVKLITPITSPLIAGRLISAVAGTLTIGVVYLLGAVLLNRRVGVAAGLLVAVSPLHIWYSQEGRMYALAIFFVALAALALVGFERSGARAPASRYWSALFGGAALLAAYTVYSALYTLIPLALVVSWLVVRHRWRTVPLLIASGIAFALYLPWLPQILRATMMVQGDPAQLRGREDFLAATGENISGSLLSLSGVGGTLGSMTNSQPLFWSRWPGLHYPLLLLLLGLLVIGSVISFRRKLLAGLLEILLLFGTVVVAILISRVSPGYADRTVLAATIGWALIAGSLAFARQPRWLSALGLASLILLFAITLHSLVIVRTTGWKQPYRELVADAARVAPLGYPVIPLGSWMPSFIDAYAPTLASPATLSATGQLILPTRDTGKADLVWLVYASNPWDNIDAVRRQLQNNGYERRLHKLYRQALYLDLYALPQAQLGTLIVAENSWPLAGSTAGPGQWILPLDGAWVSGAEAGATLHLTNRPPGERLALATLPVTSESVVTLELEVQSSVPASQIGAAITCVSSTGSPLELASDEGVQALQPGAPWQTVRTTTLCPAQTVAVRLTLRNSGNGEATFRNLRLYEATLPVAQK